MSFDCLKENACFIEGVCYEANQAKNDDLYCDPKLSQSQWSSKKGALTTKAANVAKNKESVIVTKAQTLGTTTVPPKEIIPNEAEKLKFTHWVAMVGMAVGVVALLP